MKQEEQRNFDKEAAQWDENPGRVKLGNEVADAIIRTVLLNKSMDVLDFGCGTGLVTLRLQPVVRTITGADSSRGMLDVLEGKVKKQALFNVKTQYVNFEKGERIAGAYDLIVSSMTLHHVRNTAVLFRQWRDLLKPHGRVCFADLDAEDGSFHPDKTGVFHFGFDRAGLKKLLQEAGFRNVTAATAATVIRDNGDSGKKSFPVFLISAEI